MKVELPASVVAADLAAVEELLRRPPAGDGDVQVDLSKVEQIDSAGVALLAITARRWKEAGRGLELVGPSAQVQRTLALFPSLEETSTETKPKRPITDHAV